MLWIFLIGPGIPGPYSGGGGYPSLYMYLMAGL
jgi:hypothetical protein